MRTLICLFLITASAAAGTVSQNLVTNGGFESGLSGWRALWTRQSGAGNVTLDRQAARNGHGSARIEHTGTNDWSFEPALRIAVKPGDIFELGASLKIQGAGTVTLCVSTWDDRGEIMNWSYGERSLEGTRDWTGLRSRLVVPPGTAWLQPRLIGYGPATVWVDDYSLVRQPGLDLTRRGNLPPHLRLTNALLSVDFDTRTATFSVLDRRTGRTWRQKATHADMVVTEARAQKSQMVLHFVHVPSGLSLEASLQLDRARPEFLFKLIGQGDLPGTLRFPHPFLSEPGDRLIVPMNEGISYPVEDHSIEPFRLIAYGGHGICMAFWGVTDERQGYEAIIETPDDAAIALQREDQRLVVAPELDPQKGEFGYARQLRYVFFERGGYVAMAKRYRQYAQKKGLLKTLDEKRRRNPNVDLLIGAVNVWNWDGDPVAICKSMQAAGIQRILWSRGGSPDALRALNAMKVLTSRYDIYQDLMDPANFPFLRGAHPDWTTAGWPNDIVLKKDGDWQRGWGVQGKNGEWFYCAMLCDRRAVDYARQRIPAELATHPYRCRFIDTTTASPWNECYSPRHPMTRTQSREWKMKLLDYVSGDLKLVTGCETGHDASVPFLDYFEGMLSLGPYRVPDAGRDMQRLWTEVPERVAKFQLGQAYRLPLWELVYHDCVVAQWYWGDYNNKLPALWDKRDLFNVLYGTPPMFMFTRQLWESEKERFVQSYRNTCPYARANGYSEMIDHRCLTPDRNVQQTAFANGVTITVNFGETPYPMPSGTTLKGGAFQVDGLSNGQL